MKTPVRRVVVFVAIGLAVVGSLYAFARDRHASVGEAPHAEAKSTGVTVEITHPLPGGLKRVCVQPGTLEPFQASDLFAKVSGYLVEQSVDDGSRVKEGQVLARIHVPELEKQVQKDTAEVTRTEARLNQLSAAIMTADAELNAATANVALARAELKSKIASRTYQQKQRDRFHELATQNAVDARLVDEQQQQFEAATSAELAAEAAINSAVQKEAAARAKVEQAKADESFAKADVQVAKAQLEKSQEWLGYTVIRSPYDGVVTKRNYHPGGNGRPAAFIRAADSGGEHKPLLTVERTDIMRVVVQVPDRDVPYVDVGDEAIVEIDAFPGEQFKSTDKQKVAISRAASSEDHVTRTMRTQVDLLNPTGRFRSGMYGQVTLTLQNASQTAVRIPSKSLFGKAEGGRGSVRVVKGSRVFVVPVRFGVDNGVEVEVLTGLSQEDSVVIRTNAPVDETTTVTTVAAKAVGGGH